MQRRMASFSWRPAQRPRLAWRRCAASACTPPAWPCPHCIAPATWAGVRANRQEHLLQHSSRRVRRAQRGARAWRAAYPSQAARGAQRLTCAAFAVAAGARHQGRRGRGRLQRRVRLRCGGELRWRRQVLLSAACRAHERALRPCVACPRLVCRGCAVPVQVSKVDVCWLSLQSAHPTRR